VVADLLMDGVRLMVIGMGIVFAFLLMLVGSMRVMSWAAMRLAPERPMAEAPVKPPSGASDDSELVSVIAAAVARYRKDRGSV
jgi:oxaloacetate decarboxylase gamma subunit